MTKKRMTQIVVSVLILAAIVGIWFIKHEDEANMTATGEYALLLEVSTYETLLTKGKPVMIDFGASWCGPCQAMKPDLIDANENYAGKAYVKYVDVDDSAAFAAGFPISAVPTQVFFEADGTPYQPSETMNIPFAKYAYKDTGVHALTVHEGLLTAEEIDAIFTDMGVK